MYNLLLDVRYAVRKLARTPGFTCIAVLTLALGIGATTAIFSIVNSVLLRPLPFADPARLAFIESVSPTGAPMPASPQDLADYARQSQVFTSVAAIDAGEQARFTGAGASAELLSEARVGASMFSILGVSPQVGRFFVPGEDSASAAPVVVLSDRSWRRDFGGDPHVIGQSIELSDKRYRVIGVAAPTLTYPANPDLWIPAVWHDYEMGDSTRGFHSVTAIGRLATNATFESAHAALQAIATRLGATFPATNARIGAYVQPLQEHMVGNVSVALYAMLGAVGFVLLIACVNVANLLLVRAAARQSEIALRTALGAARGRIVRHLVTESLVLSAAGAVLGTILAAWALDAVLALSPRGLPRLDEIAIDWRVIAFTAVLSIVVGVLFGLVPALHAVRSDISNMLRQGRGGAGGANRTRSALVLAEVALATVLLAGAGLLIRSFERLMHHDPGFNPSHLVVFNLALPSMYDDQMNARASEVLARLRALPGTQRAAVAAALPLDPNAPFGAHTSFRVIGEPKPVHGYEPISRIQPVSPSYFSTMGMTLVRGRWFTDAENRRDVPAVLVIDEALAAKYFPNQNAIGKQLTFGFQHTFTANPNDTLTMHGEIVGVARNAAYSALGGKPDPTTYVPYATAPVGAAFVVRTNADPRVTQASIQHVMHDADPNAPVYGLRSMDDALSASVAQPRFYTLLLGAFAAMALLLAALGIYGVISYVVTNRTREFGIRIALGATSRDVTRLVVRRGLGLTLGGIVLGGIAAAALTRVIRSLLFETAPTDVPTFVLGAIVLGVVATLASWLPARRASRTDPTVAMRAE